MKNAHYASLFPRLIAFLIDQSLLFLPISLLFLYIVSNQSVESVFTSLIFSLGIILAWLILTIFYPAVFTNRLGGTLGKLAMGLRVNDEQNELLTFKNSLVRGTAGYYLASQLFGFGFWQILKDSRHQGLHDKVCNSFVLHVHNFTLLGVALFLGLLVAHGLLISSAVMTISDNPLLLELEKMTKPQEEFQTVIQTIDGDLTQEDLSRYYSVRVQTN